MSESIFTFMVTVIIGILAAALLAGPLFKYPGEYYERQIAWAIRMRDTVVPSEKQGPDFEELYTRYVSRGRPTANTSLT